MLRIKRLLRVLRAGLSVPSLLARCNERTVVSLVAGANAGMAILTISLIAWVVDLPLLFPALGPTAFVLFSSPFSRAAAPRSVVVGHLAAIGCGTAVWHLVCWVCQTEVTLATGGLPLLVSASLALAVSCIALVWLACPHAPACASALILALGAASSWPALLGMVIGVVTLTGEAILISRIAGVNMPLWSPRERPAGSSNEELAGRQGSRRLSCSRAVKATRHGTESCDVAPLEPAADSRRPPEAVLQSGT